LLYPRLDVNVSKSTNHLLKSPFCVHPKTGNLCVPFTSQEIDTFDPFSVPQIQTLSSEEGKIFLIRSNFWILFFKKGKRKMAEYLAIFTKFLDKLASGTKKNWNMCIRCKYICCVSRITSEITFINVFYQNQARKIMKLIRVL